MRNRYLYWLVFFGLALASAFMFVVTVNANDAKYGVCHITADHPWSEPHYNYIEVGNLNGHFYNGNPALPKHGAWSWNKWSFVWDFVTVLGDEDCDGRVDEEPTPEPCVEDCEPQPTPAPCDFQQYVLRDTEGHICFIQRNYVRGDVANKLPVIYDDTALMRELCSKTCTGNYIQDFGKLADWWTTCKVCDGECEQ